MTTRPLRTIYQFKVKLHLVQPVVWRRFQISSTDTFEDLHLALQVVMGWTNSHFHEFSTGQDRYGVPDPALPSGVHKESGFRLDQVLKKEKDNLHYVYHFDDAWEHEVLLEKILPFDLATVLPLCVEGECACPMEDVGGPPGYEMFLEAISDPAHPEHDELLEWSGGYFDPVHFDLVQTNDLLREYIHRSHA